MKTRILQALETWQSWFQPDSPYRGMILALAALLIFIYLYRLTRKRLRAYLDAQAHRPENAEAFLRGYDAVWKACIAVVVIIAASGSFRLLGLSVALLGTMLGWSLQVPIRGLAAWVMIVLQRPFHVGDRVAIAGVTGDVTEIQLNHIVLNQVGGTIQGEERSGRAMLVPTAMLFGENVINYNFFAKQQETSASPVSKFMLDEVPVRVTFGSDYEFAKTLCLHAAEKAVAELVGQTDEAPFTRVEFLAWGVLIRVRYKTIPDKRQELSSRVTELIWESFNRNRDRVRFCFPKGLWRVPRTGSEKPPSTREERAASGQ